MAKLSVLFIRLGQFLIANFFVLAIFENTFLNWEAALFLQNLFFLWRSIVKEKFKFFEIKWGIISPRVPTFDCRKLPLSSKKAILFHRFYALSYFESKNEAEPNPEKWAQKKASFKRMPMEVESGFEPLYKVLQTSA